MSQPLMSASPSAEPSEVLKSAGYWMHLIREVEAAGRRLYLQGRLPGSFYDGRGQEATAVGAALAMQVDDVACPLIRDMGVHLVRGVTPAEMFGHYLGKATGPMRGRDGNIHLGAYDRGTIPMISHLPEMLPVGMGVSISRKRRGVDSVAFTFCGDGASCGGVFHETLNLSSVWRAPLIVIVERNHYAYMTPERRYLSTDSIVAHAAGYGIEGMTVDGNDVIAVLEALRSAREHARNSGPVLVEAFTYRMHGHGAHDAQKYVPRDELASWEERDPLVVWRQRAEAVLSWDDARQQALEARVAADVEAGIRDALDAPYPDPDGLSASVFA